MLKLKKKLFVCALTLTMIVGIVVVPSVLASIIPETVSIESEAAQVSNSNENFLGEVSYDQEKGVICSCGIPFSEHEKNEKLRYSECVCGGKIVSESTVYADWRYSGESKNCQHQYSNGHDYELTCTYITDTKCTKCKYSTTRTGTESKWECKGF